MVRVDRWGCSHGELIWAECGPLFLSLAVVVEEITGMEWWCVEVVDWTGRPELKKVVDPSSFSPFRSVQLCTWLMVRFGGACFGNGYGYEFKIEKNIFN